MSFSHISRNVRDVTGKTFARKFITLGKVINYWAEAVGPDLALKTYPIGMKVRKAQGKNGAPDAMGKNLEAILEVAASSADATLVHYQKALILERLRMLIGADMVVDIKITHAAVAPVTASVPVAGLAKKPTRTAKIDLSYVTDPELRAILDRMGGYIT